MVEYFTEAKERVRRMQFRILPLEDDERGVRSNIVEVYVHVHLATPHNDFSTS